MSSTTYIADLTCDELQQLIRQQGRTFVVNAPLAVQLYGKQTHK